MTEEQQVREAITKMFSECYTQEGSTCPIHPVFQPQKAINLLFSLLKKLGWVQLPPDSAILENISLLKDLPSEDKVS